MENNNLIKEFIKDLTFIDTIQPQSSNNVFTRIGIIKDKWVNSQEKGAMQIEEVSEKSSLSDTPHPLDTFSTNSALIEEVKKVIKNWNERKLSKRDILYSETVEKLYQDIDKLKQENKSKEELCKCGHIKFEHQERGKDTRCMYSNGNGCDCKNFVPQDLCEQEKKHG